MRKNKSNAVLIDLNKHGQALDNLARALDAPRGPGRINKCRKRFAELTDSLHKDAIKRGSYQRQIKFLNF